MSLPNIHFLHLTISEIQLRQILKSQGHYGKVKGWIKVTPQYCTETRLTNVPTDYQLPTPCSLWDTDPTRFLNSRSLWQGQRPNQGHNMIWHTCASPPPNQMSLPNINFLHLTVSEIQLRQILKGQGHCGKVKGWIKVTPWYCTAKPPINVPSKYQLTTPYSFWDTAQANFFPLALKTVG